MFVVAITFLAVSLAFFAEAFRRATTNSPSGKTTLGTAWPEVRLRKVVLGAFAWTVLVGAFFATVPLGETRTATQLGENTSATAVQRTTLIDTEGYSVLVLLFLPVLATLMAVALPRRWKRKARLGSGVLLALFAVVGGFSIGLPYLAAALMMLCAGHYTTRDIPFRPGR